MKSLRIGTDRIIVWHIHADQTPYDLTGKDLKLTVSHNRGYFIVNPDDLSVSGNVITWIFRGKDQRELGPYKLTLIENDGKDGMLSFDLCNAFALVACSCQEGGIANQEFELADIELSSDIAVFGAPFVIPYIGENGNWWISGQDTGHSAGGGVSQDDFDAIVEEINALQPKISNGQTAYSWGNHAGKYVPLSGTASISGPLIPNKDNNAQLGSSSSRWLSLHAVTVNAESIYKTSDERLKDFISDIAVDFQKLKTIPKKTFRWKDGHGGTHMGVSAQKVQAIYPELVRIDEKGMLSVDYEGLLTVALRAIDILETRIVELENKLNHEQ